MSDEKKKAWAGELNTPIEREPPWRSIAPLPQEGVQDFSTAIGVAFVRLGKLPALAANYGIEAKGVSNAVWAMQLASKLAVEIGVPGFQEREVGRTAALMRDDPILRQQFASELGLPTGPSGRVSGAPLAKLTASRAALKAIAFRADCPGATLKDIALQVSIDACEIDSSELAKARTPAAVKRIIAKLKVGNSPKFKTISNRILNGYNMLGLKWDPEKGR